MSGMKADQIHRLIEAKEKPVVSDECAAAMLYVTRRTTRRVGPDAVDSQAAGDAAGDEASLASLAEKSKLQGKRPRRGEEYRVQDVVPGWQPNMDDPEQRAGARHAVVGNCQDSREGDRGGAHR